MKNRLRSVKSAESLISGVENGNSVRSSVCLDYLSPPSPKLSGTTGHSRSVSHDSYFDHLAESTPIHSTMPQDEEGMLIYKLLNHLIILKLHLLFCNNIEVMWL